MQIVCNWCRFISFLITSHVNVYLNVLLTTVCRRRRNEYKTIYAQINSWISVNWLTRTPISFCCTSLIVYSLTVPLVMLSLRCVKLLQPLVGDQSVTMDQLNWFIELWRSTVSYCLLLFIYLIHRSRFCEALVKPQMTWPLMDRGWLKDIPRAISLFTIWISNSLSLLYFPHPRNLWVFKPNPCELSQQVPHVTLVIAQGLRGLNHHNEKLTNITLQVVHRVSFSLRLLYHHCYIIMKILETPERRTIEQETRKHWWV